MRSSVRLAVRMVLGACLLAVWPALVLAQSGTAPTRTAKPSTDAEDAVIQAGVALHDQGKFDEAIAKYEEVLRQSPDNLTALYELAYTLHEKPDLTRSIEVATRGSTYQSDMLPMFYDLVASSLDTMGKPEDAIAMYKKGIALAPDATTLYFNMAVTYLESLKDPTEARRWLKQAAILDPLEPEIQLMLGQVYQNAGYPTPALFAFAKYLILEPTGSRALTAYGYWRQILRGGTTGAPSAAAQPMRDAATPQAPRPGAKIDEGDFADFEAEILRSQQKLIAEMDGGAQEMPTFLAQLTHLLDVLAARPAARDQDTFIGKYYLPYFRELDQKHFVEVYAYWSMQRAPVPGVREWLTANQARVREFLDWTGKYEWAK